MASYTCTVTCYVTPDGTLISFYTDEPLRRATASERKSAASDSDGLTEAVVSLLIIERRAKLSNRLCHSLPL